MTVPEVSLMLRDPVSHGTLGEPCVGLLLPCDGVGDLSPVDHPPCHAVAWERALLAASMAVAASALLGAARPHLVVVLVEVLPHCPIIAFQ